MQHLTSINQFTKQDILKLIKQTAQIKASPQDYADKLKNKIVATLFFEPSTRTRFSFESAALRLGAKILGFADSATSSTKKGETLEDTVKIVQGFADLIVMRHPESGSAERAAKVSQVPIINGGDGINEHPTQALLDIFTIFEEITKIQDTRYKQILNSNDRNLKPAYVKTSEDRQFPNLSSAALAEAGFPISQFPNLKIAFVGDLKFGRTAHSLTQGLVHFNPTYYLISPSVLKLPDEIKQKLTQKNVNFQELETWDDVAGEVDILYMTRVQKERFNNPTEYKRLKDAYILNKQTATQFKDDCLFMHPLPRVGEIDPAVDDDPRAIYFEQAHNGIWMRMALLLNILAL